MCVRTYMNRMHSYKYAFKQRTASRAFSRQCGPQPHRDPIHNSGLLYVPQPQVAPQKRRARSPTADVSPMHMRTLVSVHERKHVRVRLCVLVCVLSFDSFGAVQRGVDMRACMHVRVQVCVCAHLLGHCSTDEHARKMAQYTHHCCIWA